MAGRRAARRTALFLLYQWDVTRQPLASLYEGAQNLRRAITSRTEAIEVLERLPGSRLLGVVGNRLRLAAYVDVGGAW